MNIEQLEYVLEVSKTKSISIASENLRISQSGVSRSISNLEHELGIKIFHRSRLGTSLTGDGEKIVKTIHEVVSKIQQLKEEAQLNTSTINGELKISTSPSLLMTILLKAIPLFKNEFPGVKVEITEKAANEIIEDIRNDRIDIGLIFMDDHIYNTNDINYGHLLDGKINVCVNKNSPLSYNNTITPKELLHENLAMYNGINTKHFIKEFFDEYGEMDVLFWSNNMEAVKRAVVEGLAITFIIDFALKDDLAVKNGDVVIIPLIDSGRSTIRFGWIQSKNRHSNFLEKEFIKCLHLVSGDY